MESSAYITLTNFAVPLAATLEIFLESLDSDGRTSNPEKYLIIDRPIGHKEEKLDEEIKILELYFN